MGQRVSRDEEKGEGTLEGTPAVDNTTTVATDTPRPPASGDSEDTLSVDSLVDSSQPYSSSASAVGPVSGPVADGSWDSNSTAGKVKTRHLTDLTALSGDSDDSDTSTQVSFYGRMLVESTEDVKQARVLQALARGWLARTLSREQVDDMIQDAPMTFVEHKPAFFHMPDVHADSGEAALLIPQYPRQDAPAAMPMGGVSRPVIGGGVGMGVSQGTLGGAGVGPGHGFASSQQRLRTLHRR